MTQPNVSDELLYLRKRARRRLVGAVALVLFALSVLWTVLDHEPPARFTSGHAIEITSNAPALTAPVVAVVQPGEAIDASGMAGLTATAPEGVQNASEPAMASPVASASQPAAAEAVTAAARAPEPASVAEKILPGKVVNRQTEVKPRPVATPKPAQPADPLLILEGREQARPPAGSKYFLQAGAYADAGKAAQVVARLKAAGMPAYAEKITTSKGELTRIRIGPTPSEAGAQEWRRKSEGLGIAASIVQQ